MSGAAWLLQRIAWPLPSARFALGLKEREGEGESVHRHLAHRLVSGLALAIALLAAGAAAAGPKVSVKYAYYPVDGTTAVGIMRALHIDGPSVNGEGAYAYTTSEMSQSGTVHEGKGCSIPRYTIGIAFTITLPAAQDLPDARPRVRAAWKSFYSFVKRHEETHKSIWIGCASSMQAKVRAIRAATCDALATKIESVIAREQATCHRKHAAFDRSERSRLAAQPLIRQAVKALEASAQ